MSATHIVLLISFLTASLIFVFGVLILFGVILPPNIAEHIKVLLGLLMVLYGIFRVVMLWGKYRSLRQTDEPK